MSVYVYTVLLITCLQHIVCLSSVAAMSLFIKSAYDFLKICHRAGDMIIVPNLALFQRINLCLLIKRTLVTQPIMVQVLNLTSEFAFFLNVESSSNMFINHI